MSLAEINSDASARKLLVFGDCELNLPMRMLWRGGELQQLEPRVFDVLELLIVNRDRVVARDELNARVWTGMTMTQSALHRALNVLRRALGSDSSDKPIIRTVHRVGYQFVAPVTERSDAPQPGQSENPALRRQGVEGLAIGLLWRDAYNRSLNLRVVKSRFQETLLELVQQQTGQRATVTFVDTTHGAGFHSPSANWATDFEAVATVDVHRDGQGCWLEWWAHRLGGRSGRSSLRGGQFDALLQPAAAGMAAVVTGADDVRGAAGSDYEDGFVGRLFARAQAMLAAQEWSAAERLFDVLAAAHPGHRSTLAGKLLSLVARDSPQAEPLARELLALSEANGDPEGRLVARYALALSHQEPGELLADPELTGFAMQALETVAAENRPLPYLESRFIHLTAVNTALYKPLDAQGTAMLKRASALARSSGDNVRAAGALGLLSALALLRDEIPLALDFGNEAMQQLGNEPAPFSRLNALSTLALLKMNLGEVGASTELQDHTLERFVGTDMAPVASLCLSGLALAAVQIGDRARLRRILALLDSGFKPALAADHPSRLASRACLALAEGQMVSARALLWQMVEHPMLQVERGTRAFWLLKLLRLEISVLGSVEAQSCLQQLWPMANGQTSPLLEAWSQRAMASEHLRNGNPVGALLALLDALSVAPGGMVQALCRLDAAWLRCELGEPDRAQKLWAAAGYWATEHPVGMAVKARVLATQGAFAEAADWQARALGAWRGLPPAGQEGLLELYRSCTPGATQRLPALPGFASDAWWMRA